MDYTPVTLFIMYKCLVESRGFKPDKLLTPILDYMSEQDRAAFMNLLKHLQDRPDKEILPRVMPDEQGRQTHTKRFATPGKYKVAWIQIVPIAFFLFWLINWIAHHFVFQKWT